MEIRGSEGFLRTDVEVADTAWRRFKGLMLRPPSPLLMAASLVHGFWLRGSLAVVGIAPDGTVTAVELLRRRRLLWLRGAKWVLELPPGDPPPRLGERLAFLAPAGEAEADAGTTVRLCHPDRQPGGRLPPPG